MKFLVLLFASSGLLVTSVSGVIFHFSGDFYHHQPNGGLGDNFYDLGNIIEEGTSSISGQMSWARYYAGRRSAIFSIDQGLSVSSLTASVPSNGTFTLANFANNSTGATIWTIGGTLPEIFAGDYAIRWVVPTYQGGPSTRAGNYAFSIDVEPIPEPSTYALFLGVTVLGYAFLRRRK